MLRRQPSAVWSLRPPRALVALLRLALLKAGIDWIAEELLLDFLRVVAFFAVLLFAVLLFAVDFLVARLAFVVLFLFATVFFALVLFVAALVVLFLAPAERGLLRVAAFFLELATFFPPLAFERVDLRRSVAIIFPPIKKI